MEEAKPFRISKRAVREAFRRVKANRGAAGVDGQSIEEFEADLENNLYKLWNRMSSGSYFPPPVQRVEIPKKGEGKKIRPLGIPTVSDRVAQMVCKMYLEPKVEPHFHADSYGYRPNKSALDAVGKARERCWKYAWVLDVDIKGFFDNIDHALLMRAVRKHTDCRWVLLYIKRWLVAPVRMADGSLQNREKGTPQGSVISPLLANLFLHYAVDAWMERTCPSIPFERYADDIICHCRTEVQAQWLRQQLEQRLAECGLQLHPEKTRIVYCKRDGRSGTSPNQGFDFLGFTFRPRRAQAPKSGKLFVGFLPAASQEAANSMRQIIRTWRLQYRTRQTVEQLAQWINPVTRGWVHYYGVYYRSALGPIFDYLDRRIARWARCKYKRLRFNQRRARKWLQGIRRRQPGLFVHWYLQRSMAGR